jgi:hypothetical protein
MRRALPFALSVFALIAGIFPLWAQSISGPSTVSGPRLMAVSPNVARFPHPHAGTDAANRDVVAPVRKRKHRRR